MKSSSTHHNPQWNRLLLWKRLEVHLGWTIYLESSELLRFHEEHGKTQGSNISDMKLWSTADGSEIPRPTTVWMVLKPWTKNRINYCSLNWWVYRIPSINSSLLKKPRIESQLSTILYFSCPGLGWRKPSGQAGADGWIQEFSSWRELRQKLGPVALIGQMMLILSSCIKISFKKLLVERP